MSNTFSNNANASARRNRPVHALVADRPLPVNALVVVVLLIIVTGSGYF